MLRLRIVKLTKLLVGALLLQGVTVVLTLFAFKTLDRETWLMLGAVGIMFGFLFALWFGSIISHHHREALSRVREDFARERERIRVSAAEEKSKILEKSRKDADRRTNRARAEASRKSTAAFAGMLGIGALMLFTQFFTFGLLLLGTGGGAVAGYLTRIRQERFGRPNGAASKLLSANGLSRLLPRRPAAAGARDDEPSGRG